MVKSRCILPAREAMLRAPWLLFHILALLSSQILASSPNKISDVAGDEGTIDQLEALLDHRALGAAEGGTVGGGDRRGHRPAGALGGRFGGQEKQAEEIQFGVGPSDPRFFDHTPADLRPNTLHTRGQPQPGFAPHNPGVYGGNVFRGGYAGMSHPNLANPDTGFGNLGNPNPGYSKFANLDTAGYRNFANPNSRFGNLGNPDSGFGNLDNPDSGFGIPNQRLAEDPDMYDQLLGDLTDQYDADVASRLRGYDQDPRSQAFVARLRDIIRSGDRDAAERMLGLRGLQPARATSQPEFVHFNHQQPHNRQVQPFSSDTASRVTTATQTSEDPKNDYNPNDPSSSSAKTEPPKTNNSGTAIGGTQLAGLPQHLGQSQHSASASQAVVQNAADEDGFSDVYFTAMVAGCTAAAVCFIIGTGVCWYRLNKNQRAAKDTEYPAYGVTGPSRELSPGAGPGGDRNLAHSAHMYHYQQQKNQMIALDKSGGNDGPGGGGAASDVDSEEEDDGEERDYTVYECPGLAPMGEMVVPNPMYPPEDVTPGSPSLKEDAPGRAEKD